MAIHPRGCMRFDAIMSKQQTQRKRICPWVGLVLLVALTVKAERVMLPAQVKHPSVQTGWVDATLVMHQRADGWIDGFETTVDSVICGDGVCEIVPVTLNWNFRGDFQSYSLEPGDALTKQGHEAFSDADYAKLLRILKDPNARLGAVHPDHIVHPADALLAQADGVSGATVVTDKEATVVGAVYTCFTLWHWAQGEMRDEIRQVSAQRMSRKQLAGLADSRQADAQRFAVQAWRAQGIRDAATQQQVASWMLEGDRGMLEEGLEYAAQLGDPAYSSFLHRLFASGTKSMQRLVFSELMQSDRTLSASLTQELAASVGNMDEYALIHLALQWFEAEPQRAKQVVNEVVSLLDHRSFLIVRRACRFLEKQTLSVEQHAQVETVKQQYNGRL